MHKYRKGKIKVEHKILEGAENILKEIEKIDCVKSIIPGEIKRTGGKGKTGLFLKYQTQTGFKFIFRYGTAFQEIFVVCSKGKENEFLDKLKEKGIIFKA